MPHVLVADDNPDVRDLVTVWLRRAGFHVSAAATGREAARLLQDVHKDARTKQVPNANITLQIQWVPFDFTF